MRGEYINNFVGIEIKYFLFLVLKILQQFY